MTSRLSRAPAPEVGLFFAPLLAAVLLVPACNRTPPEPTPAATTSEPRKPMPAAASAQTTTTSRCIARLPATPPPIPPPVGSACPADPEPNLRLPVAEVSFPDAPSTPKVEAELAMTPHHVERGLMYRRAMAPDHGMLFKLDSRREHTFWMHNTCIPLDMLFIDEDGVIVGVVEAATPLTDTIRSVGCPSSFVLEVNAGWVRNHGVEPGQRVALPAAVR
jgi:uncharacterized membrane protein (UPF0127 family)